MLKACWECLVGYDLIRDGTRGEEPDSVQLNGNINRAPPWPKPKLTNEKMFILPKIMSTNDTIVLTGTTFDQRNRMIIGLVTGFPSPDHTNVACQLDVNFYETNKIAIQVIKNGYPETVNDDNAATDYFSDLPYFQVKFRVRSNEIVDVHVGESYLESIQLKHNVNEIRFLSVHGDIEKVATLDFSFG